MATNSWKKIKKENDRSELNLSVEDIGYVNKVCVYAESHGVGSIETQLLRKDLIGMGLEAKKEGSLLEERLGAVDEFAKNIVLEGKSDGHKEQFYTWIQWMGIGMMVLAGFHAMLLFMGSSENILFSRGYGFSQLLLIVGELFILTILHVFSGRFIMGKKKDNMKILIFVGFMLLFKSSQRSFMAEGRFNEIMLPNWILFLIIGVGFILYIVGTYLFDNLLKGKAREYHLEKK